MTDSTKQNITVNTIMGHSIVDFSKDNENYMLLTLKGGEVIEETKRPPISIIALLDVSSSMSPEYKIEYLKKSMMVLIDNLKANDNLSIIAYSSGMLTVLPVSQMTNDNKKKATKAVSNLIASGMTNMSGALAEGYDEFKKADIGEGINRVILFTDGCPTTGNTNQEALIALAENCPQGAQITTMGYGKEIEPNPDMSSGSSWAFAGMGGELNVVLLQEMAKAGKGNYYYMSNPDSCGRAFANELGGLLTVVGQNIKITVDPKKMSIAEVMDDVDVEEKDGKAVITIPDILAEETRYILLKVNTPKQDKKWARPASIADITVTYIDTIKGEKITVTDTAKVKFTNKDFDSIHPEVNTQIGLLKAIEAQKKADELAAAGHYDAAVNTLNIAAIHLQDTGTDRGIAVGDTYEDLKSMYGNRKSFEISANTRLSSSHSLKSGRAGGGVFDTLYSTRAQKNMQKKFVSDDDPVVNDTGIIKDKKPDKPEKSIRGYSKKSSTNRW